MRRVRILGFLGVLSAFLAPVHLVAQEGFPPKKKKEVKKEVRFESAKARTNLDSAQLSQVSRVENMFDKIYGLTEMPEEAKALVRNAIFATLDGMHAPEKEKTDKLADDLVAVLQERQLGTIYAMRLVRGTAELLSADELSKEHFDGLMIDIEQNLSGSRMPVDRQASIKENVREIIMNSELNEAKVEAREKEREAQLEREEKEKKRKDEEAKKKAKRRARGAEDGSR